MSSNPTNKKQPNQDRQGINGADVSPVPPESYIEEQIGEYLRQAYEDTVSEPIPDELLKILDDLQ